MTENPQRSSQSGKPQKKNIYTGTQPTATVNSSLHRAKREAQSPADTKTICDF